MFALPCPETANTWTKSQAAFERNETAELETRLETETPDWQKSAEANVSVGQYLDEESSGV